MHKVLTAEGIYFLSNKNREIQHKDIMSHPENSAFSILNSMNSILTSLEHVFFDFLFNNGISRESSFK